MVAIVGRPNVGKSSLFNRLVGKPIAIVDPTAGVTRDRLLHAVRREEARFDLIDTGGIGIVDEAKLAADVEVQIRRAIEHADLICFVVDGRDGPTHLDRTIADRLRPHRDRILLVVNKIDHPSLDPAVPEFAALGCGDPLAYSAEQLRGMEELLGTLGERLPASRPGEVEEEHPGRLRICLAGRRNVGKSSLTNRLLGEERMIVADLPGTTRDAIDVPFERDGHRYLLIDTAGLRKRRQLSEDLEFYAACRTERAIRRSEVVLLVLDAAEELGLVDKRLAHFCEAEGKPTLIVINKWDLAIEGGADRKAYERWLRDRLPGLRHAPLHCTSALRDTSVDELLDLARGLHAEGGERIPTAELNELIEAAVARRRPRKIGKGPTRIYYATQADTVPPTFVVFVNRTDWIEAGYHRYLEGFLRRHTPFKRVPIRIVFKARDSRFHEGQDAHARTNALTRAEARPGLVLAPRRRRGRGDGKGQGHPGGGGRR